MAGTDGLPPARDLALRSSMPGRSRQGCSRGGCGASSRARETPHEITHRGGGGTGVFAVAPLSSAQAAAGTPMGIAALLPPAGSTAFPVRGAVVYGEGEARFGADRGGRMHEGQDLFAPAGTPLVAVRDVKVLEAGDGGGRGNYVAL